MDAINQPVSLGPTALDVWRAWRSLPWQDLPTYGNALGYGEYCWVFDCSTPSGFTLHRVLDVVATRPATASEEESVWGCVLSGDLRIYNRRNSIGVSMAPVRILHEMTGKRYLPGFLANHRSIPITRFNQSRKENHGQA